MNRDALGCTGMEGGGWIEIDWNGLAKRPLDWNGAGGAENSEEGETGETTKPPLPWCCHEGVALRVLEKIGCRRRGWSHSIQV